MLATHKADGSIVARPMSVQQHEEDDAIWLFSNDDEKVKEIEANPQVNVSFSEQSYLSISGKAEIIREESKKKELWKPDVKAWFQKEYDDPTLVLIKIKGEAGEYWESDGKIATAIEIVSSMLKGKEPEPGENKTFKL
jgi:general stress protein 26